MIVNLLRRTHLLQAAPVHNRNPVAHGQGLLLIMGYIDKCDSKPALQRLQLALHLLSEFQIQSSQRLVQKEHLGTVYQSPRNRHSLLLPARHLGRHPFFHAVQLHQLDHLLHPAADLIFFYFFLHQSERDIVKYVHMGKEGIILKHRVDIPLIGLFVIHVFSLQKNLA